MADNSGGSPEKEDAGKRVEGRLVSGRMELEEEEPGFVLLRFLARPPSYADVLSGRLFI